MKKNQCLLAIALTVLMISCSETNTSRVSGPDMPNTTAENQITNVFPSDTNLNPYSTQNMTKAFNSIILYKKGTAVTSTDTIQRMQPNYLYVRFLPYGKKGSFELKHRDTNLVLFKHPMDYKRMVKPVVYFDSTLSDSITPYFATVPVGYDFGTIQYEVLMGLVLVEPLDDLTIGKNGILAKASSGTMVSFNQVLKENSITMQQVELMSLLLTGNLDEKKYLTESMGLKKGKAFGVENVVSWNLPGWTWKPKGVLKFHDDILEQDVPLVGVRVTGGYSYYWRTARTKADGSFSIPENWSYSIDYEANFDCDQYLLEDGHSFYGEDLEIEKNDKKSAWKETFTGNKARWSIVWTAARQYWYGDIGGLKRPRSNDWWNQSLDIWVYYKNDSDYDDDIGESSGEYSYSPLTERIAVRTYERNSRSIYTTTIHEIAHSSHYWNMSTHEWDQPQVEEFSNLPTRLKETYTKGIEWYLTGKRYGGNWQPVYLKNYTGLIQDLVDNDNKYASGIYGDFVSGYTVPQIEATLLKVISWDDLKAKLKKDYPSEASGHLYTKESMDALFKYWAEI